MQQPVVSNENLHKVIDSLKTSFIQSHSKLVLQSSGMIFYLEVCTLTKSKKRCIYCALKATVQHQIRYKYVLQYLSFKYDTKMYCNIFHLLL